MTMPLNQLLPQAGSSVLIRELTLDSRQVLPGDLFLALPGCHVDGRDYITDAIRRGAAAVAYEAEGASLIEDSTALLLPVRGLQEQLSAIAGRFYGEPSRALTMIGVTGTNGKTTVTHLLAQALELLGESCAVMGTMGNGFLGSLRTSQHTTPDPVGLQSTLAELRRAEADVVAMEVSSHGLAQKRLAAVELDIAVLTNLSRDHLDYHGSMLAYAQAKAQLFAWPGLRAKVINLDDAFGAELAAGAGKGVKTYSIERTDASIHCRSVKYTAAGIEAAVVTTQGEALLRSNLLGQFNLSNLLAVVATLSSMGYALGEILPLVPRLHAPAGRMQAVNPDSGQPLVVVDYAHTPVALQQALQAARLHVAPGARLVLLFGCGGERDAGKRPLMAQMAAANADLVVVTDDNPRSEDAAQIRQQILAGFGAAQLEQVQEIAGRAQAIAAAVALLQPGDVLLLAGKGHEDYQEINGHRLPFSDLEQARQALTTGQVADD